MQIPAHKKEMSIYTHQLEQMFIGKDDEYSPVGILLHGFGSNAQDMESVAEALLEQVPFWVLPQGPIKLIDFLAFHAFAWFPDNPVHITEALLGAFWKNIHDLDLPEMQTVAKKIVGEIILPLRQANPIRPIVLAGFSQGGMMATEIMLHCIQLNIVIEKALLFSTCSIAEPRWHSIATEYLAEGKSSVKAPHLLQFHGKRDEVIMQKNAQRLNTFWKEYTPIEFIEFDGHHEIPPQIIDKTKEFIRF